MISSLSASERSSTEQGELFSLLLRLNPIEPGYVSPGAGYLIQAAFLDLVRQGDPALSEWLHTPNQRHPYTLSLLQGFNHLSAQELGEATAKNQMILVRPGQTYWLRITMLDALIFSTFLQCLITRAASLTLRIGDAHFAINRLITTQEEKQTSERSWAAYSLFAEVYGLQAAQKYYEFEFASPTTFRRGQTPRKRQLWLWPEPALVFESLARQWDLFAPPHLRLVAHDLTSHLLADWCEEYIIVTRYTLETRYLSSNSFGLVGFLGNVTYEVKGDPTAPEARWLSMLARFALFGGIGYKTAMGMGQARCIHLPQATEQPKRDQED